MTRAKVRRQSKRNERLLRLEELHRDRAASLPPVDVVEFSSSHLRMCCEGRSFDYWPSTGRAWETGSCRASRIMEADELWMMVTGEVTTRSRSTWQSSTKAAHERRVSAFLKAADTQH